MKKYKLYLFIIVIIQSLIFTVSAVCNQCAIPTAATESSESAKTESAIGKEETKQ